LAELERDDKVDLTTAMGRLEQATEAARRANGVGIEHVAERVTEATEDAIAILEAAVDRHPNPG